MCCHLLTDSLRAPADKPETTRHTVNGLNESIPAKNITPAEIPADSAVERQPRIFVMQAPKRIRHCKGITQNNSIAQADGHRIMRFDGRTRSRLQATDFQLQGIHRLFQFPRILAELTVTQG